MQTRSGMARHGHLADGRLKLVLVRKCSPLQVGGAHTGACAARRDHTPPAADLSPPLPSHPLQYLRFLLHMSRSGCAPGALPYVQVLDAVAVQVEPLDGGPGSCQSCWNLDGELLAGPGIAAEVHHGLLRVFSRGIER